LLTNFREDKQLSMLKFGEILTSKNEKNASYEIKEFFPQPLFSKISSNKRFKKYAAYFDKYLIFPRRIKHKLQCFSKPVDLIHIIDQSNSVYLPQLKKITQAKKIITCHDLIAIRTSYGDFTNAPQTSKSGKRLQRWIHHSLGHADFYACDSLQTKLNLNRLVPSSVINSSVIHLGTENNVPTAAERRASLRNFSFNPCETNYILHVGSAAWYKNRKAVYKAFRHASEKLPCLDLKLILVGPKPQNEEIDIGLSDWFQSHPNSLICLNNISANSLGELYKHAKALVFPSNIEGFGWPPLEAAVHGCTVITTRTGAIYDLLGNYGHYVDVNAQSSIDQAVIQAIKSPDQKIVPISLPSHDDCRDKYFDLYEQMIAN
jgi:glycosyltransferase involved in cell wall biosynthesis